MKLVRCLAVALCLHAVSANAGIIQIGSMTNPHSAIDFGDFSVGSTSLAAINSFAPDADILSLDFNALGSTGVYNTDLGSGNALALDGSGELAIVPEDGAFFDFDRLEITIGHYMTQFGFGIADRSGATVSFYDGAIFVGSIISPNNLPTTNFFESDVAFNRIVIEQARNWVVTELVFESKATSVSEPSMIGLLGLGLAGLGFSRRKRNK